MRDLDRLDLATHGQFREAAAWSAPIRAGIVTEINTGSGSAQVRVSCDDPDGGDVLAWPLNGDTYSVDDVVYIATPANATDGAIVIGSK